MEDANIVLDNLNALLPEHAASDSLFTAFVGVFDGHGGPAVAEKARDRILSALLEQENFFHDNPAALRKALELVENELYQESLEPGKRLIGGSTALIVLLWDNMLHLANIGDCRAVLCTNLGKAVDLTTDQRPNMEAEVERIEARGGEVDEFGYVCGKLAVARALGDFDTGLKGTDGVNGPLTADPVITSHKLQAEDEFVIVACDGLWDVISSQNAVEIARKELLRSKNDPTAACRKLVEQAIDAHACDNITVAILCFSADAPKARFPRGNSRLFITKRSKTDSEGEASPADTP